MTEPAPPETETQTQSDLLRRLFDAMPQLGWTAQPDGFIDYYNRGWYAYTNTTYEGMKGWGWQSVHHPDELQRVIDSWSKSIATGQPWELSFPLRRADGVYRWFLSRATPIYDEAGALIRWVGINTDIDDQKRAEQKLGELDRAKTAFFSNVSHEFRTPLTLMLGPLEDALAGDAKALTGADLQTTYRNTQRLLNLVNSLLDFSSLEAGRAHFEPTDLKIAVSELASVFRSAIERAGLALVIDCAALPGPFHIDHLMLEKIVFNLLSNALKFTFEGTIAVELVAIEGGAQLTVRDTGTGIAAEELPRVFERFHRVEGVRARTIEGAGIGLALVDELVRLHGGAVRAQSSPGKGSSFIVTFRSGSAHLPQHQVGPRRPSPPAAGRAAELVADAWAPRPSAPDSPAVIATEGARILVADDNADMRDYIVRLLRQHWAVDAVADGEAALLALKTADYDLVLSDVMMPSLDGLGLMKAIKTTARTELIPVILVSAHAGEESRTDGLSAGADDFLTQPFSARELKARVSTHLQLGRLRHELKQERAHAVQTSRAKDEFLAMLGHELRNPLAPMRLAISTLETKLRKGESPSRQIQILDRQTESLSHIVDELLDVARVTRGTVELHPELTELGPIVSRALETVQPLIEEKRHDVDVTLPRKPLRVKGDVVRLEQILVNLLTNAARYTSPGGRISVVLSSNDGCVEVRVKDNGVGIEPSMLGKVFELFEQGSRALDRSQGGLGIGLTVVKNLVALHGGTVEALSQGAGKGSEFIVRLPQAAEQPTPPAPLTGPAEAQRARQGMRILVVDDNKDAAEIIAEALADMGHETMVAHDGPSAIEVATRTIPNLVLLDIGLPGLDGYEVARRLRKGPAAGAILVALTGYGQAKDKAQTAAAGFDRHLVKPVKLETLEEVLEESGRLVAAAHLGAR